MVFGKKGDGQIINGNKQVKKFSRFVNTPHAASGHCPGKRCGLG